MSKRVLIAYTTNAGSTLDVAKALAVELEKRGLAAEVCRMEAIQSLDGYDAAIVGGPMILGWHRSAVGFLKKHRAALSRIPVAYFFTAMSLTRPDQATLNGIPVTVDPRLAKDPVNPGRPNMRERYATVPHYLGAVLSAVPALKPVTVGIFGGKLDYSRLNLLQMLFVMLIVQAQPGDRRNWPAIREWAAGLPALLAAASA